jgi:hypothetical protein
MNEYQIGGLTAYVNPVGSSQDTGAGAGVDSACLHSAAGTRGSRENSKPEKCLNIAQNPQRPVHALLGGDASSVFKGGEDNFFMVGSCHLFFVITVGSNIMKTCDFQHE